MPGAPTSLSDFEVVGSIGEGAYSSVFKVHRRSDRKVYALKKVLLPNLTDKEKRNALNEVRLLASVRHDNVVAYKESFFDEPSQCLCIVTEYADGQDLFQKIQRHQKSRQYIPESEIWHVMFGLTQGLRALHGLRILHRDLKSANVFLTCRGDVKLGDFNVSKVAKRGLLHTQTGTPYYASPEVWKDMPYDAKSDIWSLGCVAYEMAALKPPFRADDMEGLYKKVLQGRYPRIPGCYSQDLGQLITQLLQVNPKQRPSIAQLLQSPLLLRHAAKPPSPPGSPCGGLLNTIQLPRGHLELYKADLPPMQYGQADEAGGPSSAASVGGESYEDDWHEEEKPRRREDDRSSVRREDDRSSVRREDDRSSVRREDDRSSVRREDDRSVRREDDRVRRAHREEWREESKPRRRDAEHRREEEGRSDERRPARGRAGSRHEEPCEERRRHSLDGRSRHAEPVGAAYAAPSCRSRRRSHHRSYQEERERIERERRERRERRSKSLGSGSARRSGKLRLPSLGPRCVRERPARAKIRLPPLPERV